MAAIDKAKNVREVTEGPGHSPTATTFNSAPQPRTRQLSKPPIVTDVYEDFFAPPAADTKPRMDQVCI